jgi:hypothetical protein
MGTFGLDTVLLVHGRFETRAILFPKSVPDFLWLMWRKSIILVQYYILVTGAEIGKSHYAN